MQTIGTRAGEAHRGDFIATCFYCGAAWYRSELRRNAAGQLICPDDDHIRDPVTLSRLNAARASRLGKRKVDGGIADTDGSSAIGPRALVPELLVAGWDAASGLTPDSVGRAASWTDLVGGVTLERPHAGIQNPKIKTDGPNARTYVSFEGANALVSPVDFTRPIQTIEPTFYWAIVRRPRWSANVNWWNFDNDTLALRDDGAHEPPYSGQHYASTVNSIPFPMGPWKRVEALFLGTTLSYLKIGNESATSVSEGTTPEPESVILGTVVGGFAWIDICEFWILRSKPSDAQLVLLDDYANAKFGGGVLL